MLPSTTVGYLSIDLDPSGGQKIDAFRTLNKFPAFKNDVGVDTVDELRHKIGAQLISDSVCSGLDYSRDVDPWLGDRMAGAVVPLGADQDPHLVAVVQVKDDDQARAGIAKINDCADTGDDPPLTIPPQLDRPEHERNRHVRQTPAVLVEPVQLARQRRGSCVGQCRE